MGSRWVWLAALCLVGTLLPAAARARSNGFPGEDCTGCHRGSADKPATVSIVANPSMPQPGQTVRLTVSVSSGTAAGLYFRTTAGELTVPSGQSLRALDGYVMHTAPKAASNGTTTFAIDWKAPDTAGDAELSAFALATNGDRNSTGDSYGSATLGLVFGCTGKTYYPDYDLDGYGSELSSPRVACTPPQSYADVKGDCDDYDPKVNPGAAELCNEKDDDCDGMIDENVVYSDYCEDKDGDGHGVRGGATKNDCTARNGFGLCDNDCDDSDPKIHPGADELCNYKDDNCNGRIDEGARMTCGEGWCRRTADSCTTSLCTPGDPVAEECNALDDDCDGIVDDGDLCPGGQSCRDGVCVPAGSVPTDAGAPSEAGVRDAGPRDAATTRDTGTAAPSSTSKSSGCALHGSSGGWALLLLALLARRNRRSAPTSVRGTPHA